MSPSDTIESADRALRAASALWRDGLLEECHRYMLIALDVSLGAWIPADAPAESERREELALAALEGAGHRRVGALRRELAASRRSDPTSSPGPEALSSNREALWEEIERLVLFSARHFRPAGERRRRRRILIGALLALVTLVIVIGFRLWGRPRVVASAVYSPERRASYVVDGTDTEWLLPDRTPGWVDLYLPRARRIDGVRVVNGHNRYFLDRAARRIRVTAYSEHQQLASAEAEFRALKDGRDELKVRLKAKGVTRIRLDVLSFFGSGGAIAEIEPF